MKKGYLILISCLIVMSCSKDDDASSSTTKKILGRFVHKIPDCIEGEDFSMNCSEFVEFMSNSEAGILLGGTDIVWTVTYSQNENKIEVDKMDGFDHEVSFSIQNQSTLKRIEDGQIWTKEE